MHYSWGRPRQTLSVILALCSADFPHTGSHRYATVWLTRVAYYITVTRICKQFYVSLWYSCEISGIIAACGYYTIIEACFTRAPEYIFRREVSAPHHRGLKIFPFSNVKKAHFSAYLTKIGDFMTIMWSVCEFYLTI